MAASLPALTAAYRLTQKAAGVGFDWPDAEAVVAKLEEELAELRAELRRAPRERAALAEELGDLLFTAANLARQLDVDAEAALARANLKFRARFGAVEAGLAARGRPLGEATLAEMDELWERAKDGSTVAAALRGRPLIRPLYFVVNRARPPRPSPRSAAHRDGASRSRPAARDPRRWDGCRPED